jgi:hypothetical protein
MMVNFPNGYTPLGGVTHTMSDSAIATATNDIVSTLGLDEAHRETIREIISRHCVARPKPVARTKTTPPTGTKQKGSNYPNHYAFLHAVFAKNSEYAYVLDKYEFRFRNTAEGLKEKQLELFNIVSNNDDQLSRFLSFSSVGQVGNVVQFIEKELKDISQMTRTALIWQQFLTDAEREHFKLWYRATMKEHGAIEKRPHVPAGAVTTSIQHVEVSGTTEEAPMEDPYQIETESEDDPAEEDQGRQQVIHTTVPKVLTPAKALDKTPTKALDKTPAKALDKTPAKALAKIRVA